MGVTAELSAVLDNFSQLHGQIYAGIDSLKAQREEAGFFGRRWAELGIVSSFVADMGLLVGEGVVATSNLVANATLSDHRRIYRYRSWRRRS